MWRGLLGALARILAATVASSIALEQQDSIDSARALGCPVDKASSYLSNQSKDILRTNLRNLNVRLGSTSSSPPQVMAILKHSIDSFLPSAPEIVARFYETLHSSPEAYGVASLADAIAIRRMVPNKRVLVLYPVEFELCEILLEERIDIAVSSVSWIQQSVVSDSFSSAGARNRRLCIHIFIDTGHARSGAAPQEALEILKEALRHEDKVEICGVMSHFCCNLRADGPRLDQLLQKWGIYDISNDWPLVRLESEAARMHAVQKRRVQEVFSELGDYFQRHKRAPHRFIRHVAASNAVTNGENDVYHDMVRIGGLLFRGITSPAIWNRPRCMAYLGLKLSCSNQVRVQARKTILANRGSEWCLGYGCMIAPHHAKLPFVVSYPLHVALLSGICHEIAQPYSEVWTADDSQHSPQRFDALGDLYGRILLLPSHNRRALNISWNVLLQKSA